MYTLNSYVKTRGHLTRVGSERGTPGLSAHKAHQLCPLAEAAQSAHAWERWLNVGSGSKVITMPCATIQLSFVARSSAPMSILAKPFSVNIVCFA